MRVTVVAIGRTRDLSFRTLWQDYSRRCVPPPELRELEDKRRGPGAMEREGQLLIDAIPAGALVVALDPGGVMLDSPGFAKRIGQWQESGIGGLVFVIGGADGLAPALLQRAAFKLSLGPMTLPHHLARIVLIEQYYRATTILAGHPYHRE